ncbi:HpcH/HpaI aldolase/citrate lyase family protein [Metabacillus fastidiosus]|uniref:HpcH/HpaI aldolase/citrate lyase family protein n=1 Tax=Metabacillus fastidiosus TaxID=1458 RepID=UPI003D2A2D82
MQHFSYLSATEQEQIFYKKPMEFYKGLEKEMLAYALGATLYMPGTRIQIAHDILSGKYLKGKYEGLTSMVFCLEDSISDDEVEIAELNIVTQVQEVHMAILSGFFKLTNLPLIFIRIRNPEQMLQLISQLGEAAQLISGFVFPKFTHLNGEAYLKTLLQLNEHYSLKLYGMPIFESPEIIYIETRAETLIAIKALLDQYYDLILNVRIGATDFSGLFGIRRSSDTTIYDIAVIRDCITDIINVFARSEREYVISGPVWEYFHGTKRILKPQIRQTPFQQAFGRSGLELRSEIISRFEDGLIHEVLLDKTNGIVGKTIIHPSHIQTVQSLNVVTFEEYIDAKSIMDSAQSFNGVIKSDFSNKMNEVKPHYNWARKTMMKSNIYGVFHEQQSFIELLSRKQEEYVFI